MIDDFYIRLLKSGIIDIQIGKRGINFFNQCLSTVRVDGEIKRTCASKFDVFGFEFFFEFFTVVSIENEMLIDKSMLDFCWRTFGNEMTRIDNGQIVRIFCFVEIVSGEKNSGLMLFSDIFKVLPKVVATERVKTSGGFVEKKNFGVMHEGANNFKFSLHTTRESFDWFFHFVFETKNRSKMFYFFLIALGHERKTGTIGIELIKIGMETNILFGSEIIIKTGVLKNNAYVLADLVWFFV